jgi:hypothetical protein
MDRVTGTATGPSIWDSNSSPDNPVHSALVILSERSPNDRRLAPTHALDFSSGYRSAYFRSEKATGTRAGTRKRHPRIQGCLKGNWRGFPKPREAPLTSGISLPPAFHVPPLDEVQGGLLPETMRAIFGAAGPVGLQPPPVHPLEPRLSVEGAEYRLSAHSLGCKRHSRSAVVIPRLAVGAFQGEL